MKAVVTPFSTLQLLPRPNSMMRVRDFIELMKPRVMSLSVFTALVGLLIAPIHLDLIHQLIALLAIAAGAGAAGALNMWCDADIDALMARTARRPLPRGKISRREALLFGLGLACSAVSVLAAALNFVAAALLAVTISFYIIVYTIWLKRRTPQNIVIGWAAATGDIGLEPLVLFLIIFLWTPPHFWALCINRAGEYSRAGIPMLPVVAGRTATTHQILIYSILLVSASMLPWALGFAGAIYGVAAVACGGVFVGLAWRLCKSAQNDRQAAQRLFAFSIFYLFILFAALLGNSSNNEWPAKLLTYTDGLRGSDQPTILSHATKIACSEKREGGLPCTSEH